MACLQLFHRPRFYISRLLMDRLKGEARGAFPFLLQQKGFFSWALSPLWLVLLLNSPTVVQLPRGDSGLWLPIT